MFPHDAFRCAGDDQWIAIAVRDDADWRKLVAEVAVPELNALGNAGVAERRTAAAIIERQIARWTEPQNASELEARLQRLGIPAHAVMNAAIVKDDAQLAQREHFVRTTHEQLGEVYVEGVGFRFSDMQPRVGKIPSLGGDSDWVMREILGKR
jgi:benzylsuccinate CoA-transferase BbsF subunit